MTGLCAAGTTRRALFGQFDRQVLSSCQRPPTSMRIGAAAGSVSTTTSKSTAASTSPMLCRPRRWTELNADLRSNA